jgi:hypothetical protein
MAEQQHYQTHPQRLLELVVLVHDWGHFGERKTSTQQSMEHTRVAEGTATIQDIKNALVGDDRKLAVLLWRKLHAVNGKLAFKKTLYEAAKVRRSEFGKWERGGLTVGGKTDKRIRAVLLSPAL